MRLRLFGIVSAALLAASCASDGPPDGTPGGPPPREGFGPSGPHGHRDGGGRAGGPGEGPRCFRLFSSPSGEPFRRSPGAAACPLDTWFAGADTNKDGALDPAEFRNDALRFFATLDVDGDGAITAPEIARYERQLFPEMLGGGGPRGELGRLRLLRAAYQPQEGGIGGMGGMSGSMGGPMGGMGAPGGGDEEGDGRHGGRHGGGGGRRGPQPDGGEGPGAEGGGAARFGLIAEPEPVAAADLNFDGRITRPEFATRADQRFRLLDVDGTGKLTLPALQERLGRQRGYKPRINKSSDSSGS